MRKITILASVATALCLPALSNAGFTASTNSFAAANSAANIFTLGNVLSTTTAGTLVSFNPDTANDPQINGGDLSSYRFTLTGTAVGVGAGIANYTGSYQLYYDYAGGINVSSGTATFLAEMTSGRLSIVDGNLTQTAGPANPAFTDLAKAYNYNPLLINGTFTQTGTNPKVGNLQINFEQDAQAVPEPTSIAALSIGAIALIRRRRKV